MSIGNSHGKIILMGEHAVVYGYPAIAIPFFKGQITTTIKEHTTDAMISCILYEGLLEESPSYLDNLKHLIREMLNNFNYKENNLSFTISSNIPPQRGLGSSAAVAVSIVRAIYNYFDAELTYDELLEWVNVSETIAHGNPSGLDARLTSSSKPVYYLKNKELTPFDIKTDAYLVIADSGLQGQTKQAVGHLANLLTNDNKTYSELLSKLGEASENSYTALKSNNLVNLGIQMNTAHNLLMKCEVSHTKLDKLVEVARNSGALGAKMTGGGMGGCIIALANNYSSALRIEKSLKEHAIQTWTTKLAND